MPAEPHPTKKDLRRLSLRGVLALAVRCARRVQPVLAREAKLWEASEIGLKLAEDVVRGDPPSPEVADERSGRASLYGRSDADAGALPKNPLLDVENAMSAARFTAASAGNLCWGFRAKKEKRRECNESAVTNAEEAIAHAALVTALTLGDPLTVDARAWFERKHPTTTGETYAAREAIWTDYHSLAGVRPNAHYPEPASELGDPLDPTEEGPLGVLWPCGEPSWYTARLRVLGKVVTPDVLYIRSAQRPADVAAGWGERANRPVVMGLSVSGDSDSFGAVAAVVKWLRAFREELPDSVSMPTVVVLADPRSVTADLALDLGAAVLDPATLDWSNLDRADRAAALGRWAAAAVARPGALGARGARSLEPAPADAAMFGRQPAHVEPFDGAAFEKAMKEFNDTPWWDVEN